MGLLGGRRGHAKPATVPKLFVCPIMLDIMTDPTTTSCGHMFEHDAIINWIRAAKEAKCPSCNQPISEDKLAPCYPVKSAIEDWRRENRFQDQDANDEDVAALTETMKQQLIRHTSRLLAGGRASPSPGSGKAETAGAGVARPRSGSSSEPRARTDSDHSRTSATDGQLWARLEPLNRQYERIDINKDSFVIGRSTGADYVLARQQLSGRHCNIYRLAREGSSSSSSSGEAQWDVFLEDLSANGTYLNGRRQIKNTPTAIRHGDEISLCNRFTSQEKPTVDVFLDWVFLGEPRTPNLASDLARAKLAVAEFDQLLAVTDARLQAAGVAGADVRQKIVAAAAAWEEEHNMPVYKYIEVNASAVNDGSPRVEVLATPAAAAATSSARSGTLLSPLASPPTLNLSVASGALANRVPQKTGPMPKAVARALSSPQSPKMSGQPSSPRTTSGLSAASPGSQLVPTAPAPCVFAPSTYVVPWDEHNVVVTLKRPAATGSLTVFISTTDETTAVAGVDYSPMAGSPVAFDPQRTVTTFTFKWGPGKNWSAEPVTTASVIKIVFVLSLVPNGPVPDAPEDMAGDTSAVVLLEPPGTVAQPRPIVSGATSTAPVASVIQAQLNDSGAPAYVAPEDGVAVDGGRPLDATGTPTHIADCPGSQCATRGRGLPDRPSTDTTANELAVKVATVFRHMPAATISAAIALENRTSQNATAEDIQDSVVRKLLWYQSLPDGDAATTAVATGARSAKTAASSAASTTSTLEKPLEKLNSPSSARPRTGSTDSSDGAAATSKVSTSSVMPRIGGMPAFTSNGWIPPSELEPYVLGVTLQYLRYRPDNIALMAQNYRVCGTHHPMLESALCRDIASVVVQSAKLLAMEGYAEREVRSLLRAAADQALANLQTSGTTSAAVGKDTSRLMSPFEVAAMVRPCSLCKKPAVSLTIGDLNALYDIPEPSSGAAPFHSLHAVFEGYGSAFAARYAALHLPPILASQSALFGRRASDAFDRACKLLHEDILIANLRQGTVNSGCQMAMVFIRDQSVFIASVGGLSVHLIKANKAGAITSVELVSPVVPAGKVECLGAHPNAAAVASGNLKIADGDAGGHACAVRTLQVKLPDAARYLLITSRSFWGPTVNEASIMAVVNAHSNAVFDLPGVAQRLSNMVPVLTNDIALVLLQVMHR